MSNTNQSAGHRAETTTSERLGMIWAEAADGSEGELRWSIRCRLGWLCHAAGIDEDRSRAWALVRTVDDAIDLAAAGDAETVSQRIRLLKALQPDA